MPTKISEQSKKVKRAAYESIIKKMEDGHKLTAADFSIIREVEREQELEASPPDWKNETLEEVLEDWVLCAGVVNGYDLTLQEIAKGFKKGIARVRNLLVTIQLQLLERHGFEVDVKAKAISGRERQWLGLVTSLEQVERATADIESQRFFLKKKLRSSGEGLELLRDLTDCQLKTSKQRDALILKVIEIQRKDRLENKGEEEKDFTIVFQDQEIE